MEKEPDLGTSLPARVDSSKRTMLPLLVVLSALMAIVSVSNFIADMKIRKLRTELLGILNSNTGTINGNFKKNDQRFAEIVKLLDSQVEVINFMWETRNQDVEGYNGNFYRIEERLHAIDADRNESIEAHNTLVENYEEVTRYVFELSESIFTIHEKTTLLEARHEGLAMANRIIIRKMEKDIAQLNSHKQCLSDAYFGMPQ